MEIKDKFDYEGKLRYYYNLKLRERLKKKDRDKVIYLLNYIKYNRIHLSDEYDNMETQLCTWLSEEKDSLSHSLFFSALVGIIVPIVVLPLMRILGIL